MSEARLLKRCSRDVRWVRVDLLLLFSCSVVLGSFAIPWLYVARQAPLLMEFSRQEYWGGLPFPSLGDLPDPGIKPTSPSLAGKFFITVPPGRPQGILRGQLQSRPNAPPLCHLVLLICEQILRVVSGETEGWWRLPNIQLYSKEEYKFKRGKMSSSMAPHSSTLAWKIPWTEEPGRLQSLGLLRVRHD